MQAHTSPISFNNDSPTSKEALTGPHASDFVQAEQAELDKLCQLNTWSIVNRDEIKDQSAILHSTWVYKIKRLPSGLIDKFKARLCARGDLQQHGINYSETYSPIVQWSTIRLCLILAHKFNLLTHQCDYSNALRCRLETISDLDEKGFRIWSQMQMVKLHYGRIGLCQGYTCNKE